MKVKIGEHKFINKCRSDSQPCSHCGKWIGKGNHAYSIRKKSDFSAYNIWIHFKCLDNLTKDLKKGYNETKDKILLEEL